MNRPEPTSSNVSTRREWTFIAAMTVVGLLIRIWGLGRLGLVHFDEGIYAIAGLWPLTGQGGDPLVIPYAPMGFPFLIGLSYLIFGPSDAAAILVSVVTGTLAIPAAAWLARTMLGSGAGGIAAALAAVSGFHVAFSRMALTDATLVLCWLVGLAVGARFLERPGPFSAILLGLATGLSQLVKYSGWTLGGCVILAAAATTFFDSSRRTAASQRRLWGWGGLAALVAALVYAPWFRFVESHGGYAALMTHHRGYVGSINSWPSRWMVQLEQLERLSGGWEWNLAGAILAIIAAVLSRHGVPTSRWPRIGLVAFAIALITAPTILWWIGLTLVASAGRGATPRIRLFAAAWLGLSLLTPFYHPYARLWLPIQALGWLAAASALQRLFEPSSWSRPAFVPLLIACCVAAIVQAGLVVRDPDVRPGILDFSDSLRTATARAMVDAADSPSGLRLLARPPVSFYLAGRISASVEPEVGGLATGGGMAWALVDVAQLRQSGDPTELESQLLERWLRVGSYPTTLNLPTLLDVRLGGSAGGSTLSDAPLWLLRPKSGGP